MPSPTNNMRMFIRVQPNTYNAMGHYMQVLMADHKPYGPFKEIIFKDHAGRYAATAMVATTVEEVEAIVIKQNGGLKEKAVVSFFNNKGSIVPETRYRLKNMDKLLENLNRDFAGIGTFKADNGRVIITDVAYPDLEVRIELS